MSLQLKRYFSKHPSELSKSFPVTIIVETWNAFDELKVDFSPGVVASFDASQFSGMSLRQRIEWSLDDVHEHFHQIGREDWIWILKPSVTNKGLDSKYKNS